MALRYILLALLCFWSARGSPRVDPLVSTKMGLIRGLKATDGDYSMFLGIPYAKVDENNPFGPSIPHPDFEDTFEAYSNAAVCPQNGNPGTLDCLHLHIFVPDSATSSNRLPVMFYIHGGGFLTGTSGTWGAKHLVRHDIIIVTINYRVGVYGFMCLDNPKVPGNQGLKDQMAALRWVKENIQAFGGDPDQITISGESAGSSSVDYHLLSNLEKLYNKAILQSGTAVSPWASVVPDLTAPIKMAELLGLFTTDIDDALEYLATFETSVIIEAAATTGIYFVPCAEKIFEGVETFISEDPVNIQAMKTRNMAILIGNNLDEALYLHVNEDMNTMGNFFQERLSMKFNLDDMDSTDNMMRRFYIGDENVGNSVRRSVIDFDSDFYFQHPTERGIKNFRQNAPSAIYRYLYTYEGGRDYLKIVYNVTDDGACHADELGYLFDVAVISWKPSEEDQLMIDRITTMWSNFVKYGDPTPETTELLPVKWTPISEDKMHYMNIGSELTMQARPLKERLAFWDLFYKTNEQHLKLLN